MRFFRRPLSIGVLVVTCLVYLIIGIWKFRPVDKTSMSVSKPRESNTSELIVLHFETDFDRPASQQNERYTSKQAAEIDGRGLQSNDNVSLKQTRTGAIEHYKSLLDDKPITLRCTSCAMVSSSGFLLGKGAGQEIDQHHCVIRMNMAPVDGYQGDVGQRTTLRVLNFFTGVKAEHLPVGSRVMIWGLYEHKADLKRVLGMLKKLSPNVTIHGQTVEGERKAGELFTKETGHPLSTNQSWLSTGWFTMMIALDVCDKLHVYGMVPADYCTSKPKVDVPYHYYRNTSAKECITYTAAETRHGAHRFITEKAVFARWAVTYNISFHYPEWDVTKEKLFDKLDTPFINKYKPKANKGTKKV
ncbi:alpha-N-acetyl-neuraminyl-2,3-beta-galactosyl-1,3-N-acetyl-galactosaminide alpha-2,6-sialyltransferase-like [Patiria miniata]|uniref:Uncharacterized protein n=1 Tax=Patiria miniata TaxID=46514 RepID=A0A913ZFI9_PATMI|nr:alpha-N-acetyl-neuraminyl-2,3-beta-galactosyl-1,3-N-acetyl-galactosaminide alpha-2,6-sialyltransferase-like [Patiria miniata]